MIIFPNKFLCYFLQSALGCYQIEEGFTGTTNQIHISPDTVSNFIIPDISLEEQEKIVNEIKEMIDKQYINEIEIINKYEYIDKLLLSHI